MLDAGKKKGSHELVKKARKCRQFRLIPVIGTLHHGFFGSLFVFTGTPLAHSRQHNSPKVFLVLSPFHLLIFLYPLLGSGLDAPTQIGDRMHSTDGVRVCGKTGFSP